MIRSSFSSLLSAGAAFVSAGAAEFISHRYDGEYLGAANVSPASSDASCAPLPLVSLEIRNGILRAYQPDGHQSVKGFVTTDGFFTADYIFPGGRATLFEGIVDTRGKLTGGIVDGGCVWVVDLSKRSAGASA